MKWTEDKLTVPVVLPGHTIDLPVERYGVWVIIHREANDGRGPKGVPWGNPESLYFGYAPEGYPEPVMGNEFEPEDGVKRRLRRLAETLPQFSTNLPAEHVKRVANSYLEDFGLREDIA